MKLVTLLQPPRYGRERFWIGRLSFPDLIRKAKKEFPNIPFKDLEFVLSEDGVLALSIRR